MINNIQLHTPNEAKTVAIRDAMMLKHASPLLELSSSPKSSSRALLWSVIKHCMINIKAQKNYDTQQLESTTNYYVLV